MQQPHPPLPGPGLSQRLAPILGERRWVCCLSSPPLVRLLAGPLARPELLQGAATTLATGLELVQRLRPDLLLVGEQLDQGCGLELMRNSKEGQPHLATVLVVARLPRPPALRALQRAGVDGVLMETMPLATMSQETMSQEAMPLETMPLATTSQAAMRQSRPWSARLGSTPAHLTAREREVLSWAASGARNHEIALRLQLTPETIKSHLRNLIRKLGARDRAHACVLALGLGLMDWPEQAAPQAGQAPSGSGGDFVAQCAPLPFIYSRHGQAALARSSGTAATQSRGPNRDSGPQRSLQASGPGQWIP